MAATTTKPKSTSPSPSVDDALLRSAREDREHLLAIANTIAAAQREVEAFFSLGGNAARPAEAVRDALFVVFRVVGERPQQSWPEHSWPLLKSLGAIAESLHSLGHHLANPAHHWPPEVCLRLLAALLEASDLVIHPPVEIPAEVVELESFRELKEQHVSEIQQCLIYRIVNSRGEPDVPKFRKLVSEKGLDHRPTWTRPARRDRRLLSERPHCAGAVLDFSSLVGSLISESPMPANESGTAEPAVA